MQKVDQTAENSPKELVAGVDNSTDTSDLLKEDGDCGSSSNVINDILECYKDHYVLFGAIPVMNTDYFMERLDTLSNDTFAGFVPRWYLP